MVTNLSFSVSEDALKKFLETAYGHVKSCKLVTDDHNRSKGFAFVEFEQKDACKKALDAREFKLEGRLALIKQSNRQITTQKRKPLQSSYYYNLHFRPR